MTGWIPMIECSEHRHLLGFRRPHGEIGAFHSAETRGVRPELVIQMKVSALVKKVQIIRGKEAAGLSGRFVQGRDRPKWLTGLVVSEVVHTGRVLRLRPGRQLAVRPIGRLWFVRERRREILHGASDTSQASVI